MARFSLAFEGDRSIDYYPELIKRMERYDYYSIQIYEHIPFKPSWPLIFHSAPHAKKLKLGPVTVPVFLYDPLTLARNLGTLDELAPARTLLGISRGGYESFMPAKPRRDIDTLIRSIRLVDALLRTGGEEQVEKNKKIGWLAGMRERVEIYVGTSGPKLCEVASQLDAVDAIIVDGLWNPEYARTMRKIMDNGRAMSGIKKHIKLIARPFALISRKDEQEARERVSLILSQYLPDLIGDSPMLSSAGMSYSDILNHDETALATHAENFAAFGSPSRIVEQSAQMFSAGVDHICFGHPLGENILESIETIGKMIISRFDTP